MTMFYLMSYVNTAYGFTHITAITLWNYMISFTHIATSANTG